MSTCHDRESHALIVATFMAGSGVTIAQCVDVDGCTSFWVLGDDDAAPGRVPPHEHLGPLPWDMLERISPARCGAPTTLGRPCRNYAGRCHWHQGVGA